MLTNTTLNKPARRLEIPLKSRQSIYIPLIDQGFGTYLLTSKDAYLKLLESIEKFLKYNSRMSEEKYSQYLEKRLGYPATDISTTILTKLEESTNQSNLNSQRILSKLQESIIQPALTPNTTGLLDLNENLNKSIYDYLDTYLFTGGEDGTIKQWRIKDQSLFKEYSKVHKAPLRKLEVSTNKKY